MINYYPVPRIITAAFFVVAIHEDSFLSALVGVQTLHRLRKYPRIKMPCGEVVDMITIPKHDVLCPCGDPSHYAVKYVLAPQNDKGLVN
jgi:hypothetical protein